MRSQANVAVLSVSVPTSNGTQRQYGFVQKSQGDVSEKWVSRVMKNGLQAKICILEAVAGLNGHLSLFGNGKQYS